MKYNIKLRTAKGTEPSLHCYMKNNMRSHDYEQQQKVLVKQKQ